MKKILFIPLLFIALCLSAAPVGEKKAREIAESFFTSAGTRSVAAVLELEYVESISGKDHIYVYNRQGGGFAVIAGDDRFSPVIAFSHVNSYDSENMPVAAKNLLQCWARQIEAGKVPTQVNSTSESEGNVIVKYDTPSWGQGDPYNLECPIVGGSRSITGCVATAMSIVAYHNKWPLSGEGVTPGYSYNYNGYSVSVPSNALGRTYDYDKMLMSYTGYETSAQRNAVAALMKDMGTAIKMSYSPSASGAFSEDIPLAMSTYFRYSKSASVAKAEGYDEREWIEAIQQNLKKCGPTIISGQSAEGGHAFIFDGCTDRGYFSVNFGWDGYSNGYYMLPSIEYNMYQDAIFGLVPDRDGTSTYEDNLSFIPLYDNNNNPVYYGIVTSESQFLPGTRCYCNIGAIQNFGPLKFKGVWKVSICDEAGNIREDLTGEIGLEFDPNYYTYTSKYITIPQELKDGDRIRVVYKGQNSKDWKWVRRAGNGIIDEIILRANAEEIAEALGLKYDKSANTITLRSQIPVQYSFSDYNSNEIASGNVPRSVDTSFDVSGCASGVYVLKVTSGSSSYSVAITL